jgi:hypothetical protein
MSLPVLVDERGRIVFHVLPWFDPRHLPTPLVGLMAETLPEWRFRPGQRTGETRRAWTRVQLTFLP